MAHLRSCNNFKVFSKFVLACPAVLCFRAGSLDVGDAPASKYKNFASIEKPF
jgi:hypothetical protein